MFYIVFSLLGTILKPASVFIKEGILYYPGPTLLFTFFSDRDYLPTLKDGTLDLEIIS